ncbi:MAG: hypothetical protein EBU75_11720, partial [Betaproteobacteria bacterium]|nr:hypothetical protein [Betaproteobacteria bacterium]
YSVSFGGNLGGTHPLNTLKVAAPSLSIKNIKTVGTQTFGETSAMISNIGFDQTTTLETTGSAGDIVINGVFKPKDIASDATLTLKSAQNIFLNAGAGLDAAQTSNKKVDFVLWANSDAINGGKVSLNGTSSSNVTINTKGGTLSIGGGSGSSLAGSAESMDSSPGVSMNYASLSTEGGAVTIKAKGSTAGARFDNATLLASGGASEISSIASSSKGDITLAGITPAAAPAPAPTPVAIKLNVASSPNTFQAGGAVPNIAGNLVTFTDSAIGTTPAANGIIALGGSGTSTLISSSDSLTVKNPVILLGPAHIAATGTAKDVIFEKSINGTASGSDHFSLKVDATQLVKFAEPIGATKALQSLEVIAPTVQLKDVTTVGNQIYSAATGTTALTLLSNATLRVTGEGNKFEPNGLTTTHTNTTEALTGTIFVYDVPLGSAAIGKSISSIGFATGTLSDTSNNYGRSLTPLLFE